MTKDPDFWQHQTKTWESPNKVALPAISPNMDRETGRGGSAVDPTEGSQSDQRHQQEPARSSVGTFGAHEDQIALEVALSESQEELQDKGAQHKRKRDAQPASDLPIQKPSHSLDALASAVLDASDQHPPAQPPARGRNQHSPRSRTTSRIEDMDSSAVFDLGPFADYTVHPLRRSGNLVRSPSPTFAVRGSQDELQLLSPLDYGDVLPHAQRTHRAPPLGMGQPRPHQGTTSNPRQHWAALLEVGAKLDVHVKADGAKRSKWVRASITAHQRSMPSLRNTTESSKNDLQFGKFSLKLPAQPVVAVDTTPHSTQRLIERACEQYWIMDGTNTAAQVVYLGNRGTSSRQSASHSPESLVGRVGKLISNARRPTAGGWTGGRTVWVVAWIAAIKKHAVTFSPKSAGALVESVLVDLTANELILELFGTCSGPDEVTVGAEAIAPVGTHTFVCQICNECETKPSAWTYVAQALRHQTPFYRDRRQQLMRSHVKCAHEITCCHTCLKQWIDTGINSGQLFATCPDTTCRRKFTIADIRRIDTASADKLAARIKETELAAAVNRLQDPGYDAWATAAKAKHCPHCHAAIEKNGGCDHMVCWRCGNDFQWKRAKSVSSKPSKPVSSEPAGPSLSEIRLNLRDLSDGDESPRRAQAPQVDVFTLSWDVTAQPILPETGTTGLQNDLDVDNMINMIMADNDVQSRPVTTAQQATTPILSGNEYNLPDDLLTFLDDPLFFA